MRPETRSKFHAELDNLEAEVVQLGAQGEVAVRQSVDALVRRDRELAGQVIDGDDALDERYLDIERRILDLFALQTPVASDLRLVSAIMHINLHLERVGDQAVNVAKIALATFDLPTSSVILSHIAEMGDVVCRMLHTAIEAFERRDLELCLKLPAMDDPVDRLNRGMYTEVVKLASDERKLEWGIRMNVVARALERVGDNAVDIGEQVGFLLTGEFREFTDASHDTA
ncbi:MAG TPA: phosphate signaling complex protein PhoU [Actinomycetota bacterium]|nr:phosphate signaling complex protein PhoU [Actinomycetota bacterium]